MNRLIKISLIIFLLISPFLTTTSKGAAMGMGMGPPTPCGGPFPPCPVPLDNGILLLLVVGLALGGKKIYDSLKKNPV